MNKLSTNFITMQNVNRLDDTLHVCIYLCYITLIIFLLNHLSLHFEML